MKLCFIIEDIKSFQKLLILLMFHVSVIGLRSMKGIHKHYIFLNQYRPLSAVMQPVHWKADKCNIEMQINSFTQFLLRSLLEVSQAIWNPQCRPRTDQYCQLRHIHQLSCLQHTAIACTVLECQQTSARKIYPNTFKGHRRNQLATCT